MMEERKFLAIRGFLQRLANPNNLLKQLTLQLFDEYVKREGITPEEIARVYKACGFTFLLTYDGRDIREFAKEESE